VGANTRRAEQRRNFVSGHLGNKKVPGLFTFSDTDK